MGNVQLGMRMRNGRSDGKKSFRAILALNTA